MDVNAFIYQYDEINAAALKDPLTRTIKNFLSSIFTTNSLPAFLITFAIKLLIIMKFDIISEKNLSCSCTNYEFIQQFI